MKLAKLHALLEQYSEDESDDSSKAEEKNLFDFPINSLNQLNDLEDLVSSSGKAEKQLVGFFSFNFFF